MTKADLIQMAVEAGEYADLHHEKHGSWLDAERHQFANLVAAAERKALRDESWERTIYAVSEAVKYERETCALQVDHILKEGGGTYGDAIRARSQS